MSEFYKRFAGFPELIDYRQDQLIDVFKAIESLDTIVTDDPNEVVSLISSLDLEKIARAYNNKCREHVRGNCMLSNSIRSMSFRSFKPVMGNLNYV